MKQTISTVKVLALAIVAAGVLGGCTGAMVKENELIDKASFSLGVNPSDLTLTERRNSHNETRYTVETRNGRRYWCNVSSVMGFGKPAVSNATCVDAPGSKGSQTKQDGKPKKYAPPCRDGLEKATGTCK